MVDTQTAPRLTYADLLRYQLLPEQHCYPKQLMSLTQAERTALLDDPLTPVDSDNAAVFRAQRELLRGFTHVATDSDLRYYARGLDQLPARIWDYVVACGEPTQAHVSAAIGARALSRADAEGLLTTFCHLHALRSKVSALMSHVS